MSEKAWMLYWCTCAQDDTASDSFVIAQSAEAACLFHARLGGCEEDPIYDLRSCSAELIARIPVEMATPFRRSVSMDVGVIRTRLFSRRPFYPWAREFAMLGIREVPAVYAHGGKKYTREAYAYKGRWFVPRGALLVHTGGGNTEHDPSPQQ